MLVECLKLIVLFLEDLLRYKKMSIVLKDVSHPLSNFIVRSPNVLEYLSNNLRTIFARGDYANYLSVRLKCMTRGEASSRTF